MKKVILFLLFCCFTFTTLPQNLRLEEFGNPSPGFHRENLFASVYLNGYIYAGTEYNAHIYKISPSFPPYWVSPVIEKDLGIVGIPDGERRGIPSIATDGSYIYGCANYEVYGKLRRAFFYFNPDPNHDTIYSFEEPNLPGGINNIRDAVYYSTVINGITKKYMFFTAFSPGPTLNLIRWDISTYGSRSVVAIPISIPGCTLRYSEFLELGKAAGNRDVLYINSPTSAAENYIVTYYLDELSTPTATNLSSLNIDTRNFVADGNNNSIWVFPKEGYTNIYKINLTTPGTPVATINLDSTNTNWGRGKWDRIFFTSDSNYIYTHIGRVSKNAAPPVFIPYTNGVELLGWSIMHNGTNAFGVNGYGVDPNFYFENADLTTQVSTKIPLYLNPAILMAPTGGGHLESMTAESDFIHAGVSGEAEVLANKITAATSIGFASGGTYNRGNTTAYAMLHYKDALRNINETYYGIYNGPYVRVRSTTLSAPSVYDECYDIRTVDNIGPDGQGRILDMAISKDGNKLFIATSNSGGPGHPRILMLDLAGLRTNPSNFMGCIRAIAIATAGDFIRDIETYTNPATGNTYVYGSVDYHNIFAILTPASLPPSDTPPTPIVTTFYPEYWTAFLVKGEELLTVYNNTLYIYDCPRVTSGASFQRIKEVHYGVFSVESGPEKKHLINGNDGLVYGHYNNILFSFDRFNIGPDWYPYTQRYTVPGFSADGYQICSIAKETSNPNDYTIWVGTLCGRIFRLVSGPIWWKENSTIPETKLPDSYGLAQNYPNPFNPNTVINYQIPQAGNVSLKVYDIMGREILTLVNETKEAGYYTADFNALNLSSGIYIYKLTVNNFVSSKKMLLVK